MLHCCIQAFAQYPNLGQLHPIQTNGCTPEFQLKCLTCHHPAPEKNPMFDFFSSSKMIRNLLGEFPRKALLLQDTHQEPMHSDWDTVKIRLTESSRYRQGGEKEVTGVLEALITLSECRFQQYNPL